MSVSKSTGQFLCFNGACDKRGNLQTLVSDLTGANDYEIMRLLVKLNKGNHQSAREKLASTRKRELPFPQYPEELFDQLHDNLMQDERALSYLHGRGLTDKTLSEYKVGYSQKRDMISTPMYDINGSGVGFIGRGIERKDFRNSVDLPTGRTLWNIHNAKKHDTVIICEANFDAMRISQAGFPNVVACLGGNFSEDHAEQIERHASFVVIMTDNDDPNEHRVENCRRCEKDGYAVCRGHNPGRKLGEKIGNELRRRGLVVRWAAHSEEELYPHGAKDAGDMTDDEIRQCINNADSMFSYTRRMKDVVV